MFPEGEVIIAQGTWKQATGAGSWEITSSITHKKHRELDPELEWGYKLSKSTPGNILPPARLHALKVP